MTIHRYIIDEQTGGLPLGAHHGVSQRREGDDFIVVECDCDEYDALPNDEPLVVEFQERFTNPSIRAVARILGIKTLELPPLT